jgi:hypothetical protein
MNPLRSAILNVVHHSTRFPAFQHATACGLRLSARLRSRLVSTFRPSGSTCQEAVWGRIGKLGIEEFPAPRFLGVRKGEAAAGLAESEARRAEAC